MTTNHLIIPMPHMGVSVDEGTVTVWHKNEGDEVAEGDVLCEVATDKVDTEIAAPSGGVVARVCADVGDRVNVGEALVELIVDSTSGRAHTQTEAETVEPGTVAPTRPAARSNAGWFDPVAAADRVVPPSRRDGSAVASPVARRVAAANGIPLNRVAGTGLRGRIRRDDVLVAIAAQAETARPAGVSDSAVPRGYETVPFSSVTLGHRRRLIAEHMVRSRQTAAHMTTEVEVDMLAAQRAREELNGQRRAIGEPKLSYLPLFARAACAALREFPNLNATFAEDRLLQWGEVNLGIAVDTPEGLVVPVIRGCQRLTGSAIGEAISELATAAREKRIRPDDLGGGTFTISNPGSVGAISAMAIINQPQVAILGIPAIVRRPAVVTHDGSESIAIHPLVTLALTFDHRAVDGAEATRFLVLMKSLLESWEAATYG